MDTTFIYTLNDPITYEVRYVGKSNMPKRRYYAHMRADKTASSHKINWVQSLVKEGLKPDLFIVKEVPISEWKEWERYFIKYFKKIGNNVINHTKGGDGLTMGNQTSFKPGHKTWCAGTANTEKCIICGREFKCKPSKVGIYKCCSKKCRRKQRQQNPNKGCFKKGQKSWSKGKKGLFKNFGRSVSIEQIDIGTGKVINKFYSAAEAERLTGISQNNITNNTNGRSKSAGGFKWRKVI